MPHNKMRALKKCVLSVHGKIQRSQNLTFVIAQNIKKSQIESLLFFFAFAVSLFTGPFKSIHRSAAA